MNEAQIAGLVLLIIGGIQLLVPNLMMRFQVWTQKKIMGADYVPSGRTYTVMRVIGGFLVILAILVFAGVIK